MQPHLAVVYAIDTKRTESFLLSQDDVLDASVWFEGSKLCAHVTLGPYAQCDGRSLRRSCLELLGENYTPDEIHLLATRVRAA